MGLQCRFLFMYCTASLCNVVEDNLETRQAYRDISVKWLGHRDQTS